MVNKVRVDIAGGSYTISTTDNEDYVERLAQKVDEDIKQILKENPNVSITRAAVFCALDYLDEYKKSANNADNMRNQIKDYLADAGNAKTAAEEASREVERLRREISYLKEQK